MHRPARPSVRTLAAGVLFTAVAIAATSLHAEDESPAPVAKPLPAEARLRIAAPETVSIALKGEGLFGGDVDMVTHVFKPTISPPYPVVVYSHGRAGDQVSRLKLVRPVAAEQVGYWLSRGFAVVAPIRPGYGATGGSDKEATGVSYEINGQCSRAPDFKRPAEQGKKAIRATVQWLQSQPWADAHRIVLAGQSVGGFLTVSAGAENLPGVIGYVNFAGGAAGDPIRSPGKSCFPEMLAAFYTEAGKTTTVPNVWIYALNDQYWGAEAPRAWFAGFSSGATAAKFIPAPAVEDGNGHALSGHPRALWSPYLDAFVDSLGVARPERE